MIGRLFIGFLLFFASPLPSARSDSVMSSAQAIHQFRNFYKTVWLPTLVEGTRDRLNYILLEDHFVGPVLLAPTATKRSGADYIRRFQDAVLKSDKLSEDEKKHFVHFGSLSDLQAVAECWDVEFKNIMPTELSACVDSSSGEVKFVYFRMGLIPPKPWNGEDYSHG